MAVSWVLKPQHRSRVMFQRFMPWWNAQRRKEIAEKKQREEERKEMERIEKEKMERAEEDGKAKEDDKNQVDVNVDGGKDVEVIKAPVECNGNVDTELKDGIDGSVTPLAKCDFYDRTDAVDVVKKDSIEMPQAVDT